MEFLVDGTPNASGVLFHHIRHLNLSNFDPVNSGDGCEDSHESKAAVERAQRASTMENSPDVKQRSAVHDESWDDHDDYVGHGRGSSGHGGRSGGGSGGGGSDEEESGSGRHGRRQGQNRSEPSAKTDLSCSVRVPCSGTLHGTEFTGPQERTHTNGCVPPSLLCSSLVGRNALNKETGSGSLRNTIHAPYAVPGAFSRSIASTHCALCLRACA